MRPSNTILADKATGILQQTFDAAIDDEQALLHLTNFPAASTEGANPIHEDFRRRICDALIDPKLAAEIQEDMESGSCVSNETSLTTASKAESL